MTNDLQSAASPIEGGRLGHTAPWTPAAVRLDPRDPIAGWLNEGGASLDPPMRRLSILVVEDEPMIAMLLGELLSEMGHDVCAIVGDEEGAVAAAAFHEPDLMIVDATLGRGSGLRAVDTIGLTAPIPCVYTSGDALEVRRRKPDALVLQKPYDEADLAAAIRRAIA